MVHQPVDGGCGCHRILENLFPFAKGQVAGQHHAAAFISFGQQREEHLHFLAILLDVSQIINNQRVKLRKLLDYFSQSQVPLGNQ